ncbi:thermonuclease family protein [Peribacillus sp. SCS-37]|uniref:thermonuclease family protein n=1 Tax=Paraperibacillus esterisolvens TaxID=3115296 RepID=UPI003905D796
MKKMIYICLALLLSFASLYGCAAEDDKKADPPKDTAVEEKPAQGSSKNRQELKRPAKGLKGMVVNVVDGDTIDVKLTNGKNERVRLILVDTPETKHPKLEVQPFGKEASQYTAASLMAREVLLELDAEERDQYGRLLAYVWQGDVLFNEILIREGLARTAVYPPNTKYVDQFRKAESDARKASKGIWSIEDYAQEDGYNTSTRKPASGTPDQAGSCEGKIKGNENSHVYHVPGGSFYDSPKKENIVWFCSEKEAQDAGYRKAIK